MKKGYYIYVENCGSSGVKRKIDMQVKALSRWFDVQELMIKTSDRSLVGRIMGLFPWNSMLREYRTTLEELESPDFVYIRRAYVDKLYLAFLRDIKEKYPMCKIIVEIPVYPYKKEMLSHWYTFLMYIKEMIYRSRYQESIDRFVTYSDDDALFGVPTIRTMNGVNVKAVTPLQPANEYKPNEIHLITVALLARHHGYERVLKGLHEYYQVERKREVFFYIVGDGPEGKKYRNLVKKYKLEKYVKFYGPKYGTELDELYNIADAGLAAFGVYKDGFSKLSTIKAREYLAKGLPVILGAEDELFTGDAKYGLTFPNNSTPVDIEKIAGYIDDLYLHRDKHSVHEEIRNYAYQHADNEVTLLPVMEYIES